MAWETRFGIERLLALFARAMSQCTCRMPSISEICTAVREWECCKRAFFFFRKNCLAVMDNQQEKYVTRMVAHLAYMSAYLLMFGF